MATQKEHFAYAPETTFGTYVAPTKGYIVRSGSLPTKRTYDYPSETGFGRAQSVADPLEKVVSLSLEASLRPENLITFLKTMFASVVSTQQGVTIAYRHKFLPDDALELGSISGQLARANNVTQAFRGGVVKSFKVMAEAKQAARWSADLVVKDSVVIGGTWADGVAAPAAAAFGGLYPAQPIQETLKFHQALVAFGGTKALATNEITVTGGVTQKGIRRVEVTFEFGTEEDDFTVQATEPVIQSAQAAKRKVTVALDIDTKEAAATFLNDHLGATDKVLVVDMTGPIIAAPYPWLFRVVLPLLRVTDAPQADVDGSQGLKRVTVELTALSDRSLSGEPDLNVIVQNKELTA